MKNRKISSDIQKFEHSRLGITWKDIRISRSHLHM